MRNFLVANALYWLEEFHIDGLRVDAVASMLYLDYSRKDGEWMPNIHGGRENLEAVAFLQEMNATVYKRVPGVVMIAEESTTWPGVTAPHAPRRPRLRLQVEHGLDARHARRTSRATRCTASRTTSEMTFSLVYAFSENFVLPITHDEVVHGKGSLRRARCPATTGSSWRTCAPTSPTCGRTRASSCCSWARSSGSRRSGPSARPRLVAARQSPSTAGVQACVRDLNRVYRDSRRCWAARQRARAASSGSTPTTPPATSSPACAGATTTRCIASITNFSPVVRTGYRLGLPFAGRWDEVLNTDAEAYGGSGVGNLGAVTTDEVWWHGRPVSASVTLPPLSTVWLRFSR